MLVSLNCSNEIKSSFLFSLFLSSTFSTSSLSSFRRCAVSKLSLSSLSWILLVLIHVFSILLSKILIETPRSSDAIFQNFACVILECSLSASLIGMSNAFFELIFWIRKSLHLFAQSKVFSESLSPLLHYKTPHAFHHDLNHLHWDTNLVSLSFLQYLLFDWFAVNTLLLVIMCIKCHLCEYKVL